MVSHGVHSAVFGFTFGAFASSLVPVIKVRQVLVLISSTYPSYTRNMYHKKELTGPKLICIKAYLGLECLYQNHIGFHHRQGGTTCGAIEGSSRSLKARIYKFSRQICCIYKFSRQKCRIYKFLRQNYVFELHDKNTVFVFKFVCSG